MKRGLLVVLLILAIPVMASHIVGGEFEIIHLQGNLYRVNLILYFDQLNGSPGARDNQITAAIYRKRDNAFMQNVSFGSPSESNVDYTQPECSKGEIVTTKLLYTTTITLSDSRYNDPAGYYIIWERCCRNYTITNIYSENPDISSRAAGQTFYLEFPPVVKDGQPFINSTPRLFPPLTDYACPRKPYYVDFAGTDDDGDSLVYSMVTPLSTHSIEPVPTLVPAPYPVVSWRPPFNLTNIIGGVPDLKISTDGFLTATPMQQGLFVFAVKCEEYRDGVKIGEVRRDFQMLVVDRCPQAEPPQILGKKLADGAFGYDETMEVSFDGSVSDADRCIEVQVSDPDASKADDNFSEKVKIKAIPIGFKKNVSGILPDVTNATLVNGSVVSFRICFERCPYTPGPFQIGIVAYDDACSLPLSDTLRVTVNIVPPENNPPYFTTADVTNVVVNEGELKTWPIVGADDDGDMLVAGIIPDGFRMEDYGFTFTQVKSEAGVYEAQLQWDTRCDVYDFSKKTTFTFKVLLDDIDACLIAAPDYMNFSVQVTLPTNTNPVIDSDLTTNPFERAVTGLKRKVNESLIFNVKGIDGDNDFIILGVSGVGFNINDYDVSFPAASGNNFVQSRFQWNITCNKLDLKVKDEYTFQFIVVDNANQCKYYKADTLDVTVKVYPPDNQAPIVQAANMNNEIQMVANAMTVNLGQQITLALSGNDFDTSPTDGVKLQLIKAEGNVEPTGYVWADAEGKGSVESTFTWNPECNIFENEVYENDYVFTFRVVDDKCTNPKGDTLAVNIKIKDVDTENSEFLPPNFISPNGDNKNDFFAMVKEDENGELISILPRDNCTGSFDRIVILNRWGKQVFESRDRDFRWYADGEVSGMYFYYLKYTDKEYKGAITLAFDSSQANR